MPLPILPRNINDPTAQDARERRAIADFSRRIKAISQHAQKVLREHKPTVLTLNALDVEVKKYQFNIDEREYEFIGSELDNLIDRLILEGGDSARLWLTVGYVQPAFQQGAGMAYANLAVQSKAYKLSRPNLESVLMSPAYRRRLGYVKAREFEEMKGLSSDLKRAYRTALLDGMAQGINPLTIAENIASTTDTSLVRARRIARTEVTLALKRSRVDEAEDASENLGLNIRMMQLSALSPTTRLSHAQRHAKIYTFEQVRVWLATSPNSINCKCTFVEVLVKADGTPVTPQIIERAKKMRPDGFDYDDLEDDKD